MKRFAGRPFLLFSLAKIFILSLGLFSMVGCLDEGRGREGDTEVVAEPNPEAPTPPPLTSPERTVCDPFDAGVSARDRGLIGQLFYLKPGQAPFTSCVDFVANGEVAPSTLYFDRVSIPTRAFDLGFYTQDGQLILNNVGEPLYENFALRMESQLALAENESEGWYQLATLSDDGSVVTLVDGAGQEEVLIDNDGNHSTQFGCAVRSIYMTKQTRQKAFIYYHQGPRFHIALSLMWRPLPTGQDPHQPVQDIECGRSGNSRYFNSSFVPSVPQSAFYGILERQWKVLTNENYRFPVQAANPCAQPAPLLVSNLSLGTVTRTSVTVTWSTNRPATSQLRITNTSNGQVTLSDINSGLRTSHSLTFTGLSANTLYSLRALSTDDLGQQAESEEVAFRTPR
jgi:hypothetical protein